MTRRFLILTAGYGEGHNSAARALKEEGERRGYECRVCDLCAEAMPAVFRWSKAAYLEIIARFPWLWRALFDLADNMEADGCPVGLGKINERLLDLLDDWCPDAVLCTFPLYAPILDEARRCPGRHVPPYVVVVTDSLAVSRSWVHADPRMWMVTDERTRRRLLDAYGIDPARIAATGFPVARQFCRESLSSWSEGSPFRVLYLPQATSAVVDREIEALLAAHPDVHVTVVTGKKDRLHAHLLPRVGEGRRPRVALLGWVEEMHRLAASHHLYAGKAGGASIHECYAVGLPAMVNFFVPGQEEGNAELLVAEKCGCVVDTPEGMERALRRMLRNGGALWRAMKTALQTIARSDGAAKCWQRVERLMEP